MNDNTGKVRLMYDTYCRDARTKIAADEKTHTRVTDLKPENLRDLRLTAAAAIQNEGTKWRHNGQGMLQGYLHQGMTDETRVHIWHRSLRKEGIFENGLIHDHRFDMRSCVILGCIFHQEVQLKDCAASDPEAGYILEITNARKAKEITGDSYHMDPVRVGGPVKPDMTRFTIKNQMYTFPRFRHHKAFTAERTTVSVISKTRQLPVKARLLDQRHKGELVNSFEDTLTPEQFKHVLEDTYRLLKKAAE